MADDQEPVFSRPIDVSEVPAGGRDHIVEAGASECAAMAGVLDLVALEALVFAFTLRPGKGTRLRLEGELSARFTQTCVISLDPVPQSLTVPVSAEFLPAEDLAFGADDAPAALDPDDDQPEPIIDDYIDAGQLAYECFAAELDPYPRKAGVTFDWQSQDDGADSGPFAALKSLKPK